MAPRGALLALLLAGACAPAAPAPSAAPAPAPAAAKRVRILHTNDVHGRLLPQPPRSSDRRSVGGSAVLAAHFDSMAARFAGPTLILSAGDDMQGTAISNLSWGRATIAVHNAMGYDAAALGNHEFDWGQDTLAARVRESRFPWLAANLFYEGTERRPEWARPWAMLERGGVRVGVVGAAYPGTRDVVIADRVRGLEFRAAAPAIDQAVREARAAGADFVVVTIHEGAECSEPGTTPEQESSGCSGDLLDVARALTEPVDLIVGGHTHQRVQTVVNGIPVAENAPYSGSFSVTDLERAPGEPRARATYRAVRTPFADEVTPDTAVARVVREWDASIRPITERPVFALAETLANQGVERPLGNLLADAFRVATEAQASIVNNGSIRRGLPAGPVNYGMLYEMQPFQNAMYRVEVTGAQLRAALENAVANGRPEAHLSGLTAVYDSTAPRGQRIRSVRLEGGREVAPTDRITLGLSEFMAQGGDRYTSLAEGRRTATGQVDLNVFIDHVRSLPQPVRGPAVGRWRAAR